MYGKNAYIQHNIIVDDNRILVVGRRETVDIDYGIEDVVELTYFILKFRKKDVIRKIEWYEKLINEKIRVLSEPYVLYSEDEVEEEIGRIEYKLSEIRHHEKTVEKYKFILNFLKKMKKYVEG